MNSIRLALPQKTGLTRALIIAIVAFVVAALAVSVNAQPPPLPTPPGASWKATENPNPTITPGQMRSDREQVPGGFSKADADTAETMEAAASGNGDAQAFVTPGCQVYWPAPFEVCGAIKDKYNELGGPNSFLLWPTTNEIQQPDGIGAHSVFQNGPIYWAPWAGAHPVVNHFYAAWQRNGWEGGVLGYPTSDEIVNPDGIGRRQYFDGGTIYWKLNEAYFVGGAIRDKWGETGWEGGYLGYPISDELSTPDGRGKFNRFEHGWIYWTPEHGAHAVHGGIGVKWSMTNFEIGPYGFPTSDQRPRSGARDDSVDQDFEHGTIGAPTSGDPDSDIDWQEEYVDQNTCNSCGDDDRVAVTGPGWTPPTDLGPAPRDAEIMATSKMPICRDIVPDPTRSSDERAACRSDDADKLPAPTAIDSQLDEAYCTVELPGGQWGGDRDYQCMWEAGVLIIYNPRTGEAVGSVSVIQETQFRTHWNTTTWDARVALHIIATSEEGDNASYAMSVTCATTGSCNSFTPETLTPVTNKLYKREFGFGSTVSAGAIVRSSGIFEFAFTTPRMSTEKTEPIKQPTVRCDQVAGMRNSSGCVVVDAEPILDMRTRNVIPHAGHIGYAQSSGLPGAPNKTPLTRTTNNTIVQNNRNTTCNRVPGPRPAGRQCDEYPFASTLEGGIAGGPARTYGNYPPDPCPETLPDWVIRLQIPVQPFDPKGISMCMMPGRDNMRGGGILSWFYVKSRVLDGDTLYVRGL